MEKDIEIVNCAIRNGIYGKNGSSDYRNYSI